MNIFQAKFINKVIDLVPCFDEIQTKIKDIPVNLTYGRPKINSCLPSLPEFLYVVLNKELCISIDNIKHDFWTK